MKPIRILKNFDKDDKNDLEISTMEIRRKEKLKTILNHYIIPKLGEQKNQESSLNFEDSDIKSTNKSLKPSQSVISLRTKILHNNIIYPSPETSRLILQTNKETYERMMARLKSLEQNEFLSAKTRCQYTKQNLDFFSFRARKIRGIPGSLAISHNNSQNQISPRFPKLTPIAQKPQSKTPCIFACFYNFLVPTIANILKARNCVDLPYKWLNIEVHGDRPETREGGTLTTICTINSNKINDQKCYLFGGLSRDLYSTIHCLKSDSTGKGFLWELENLGESNLKRFGHSACGYGNFIVIFGGARLFNKESKRRDCMNDIQVYNTTIKFWSELKCDGICERRRCHAACIVGNYMVVNGGLNAEQHFISSTLSISLNKLLDKGYNEKTYRWSKIQTLPKNGGPQKIAYHACQLVISPERLKYGDYDLYSFKELKGVTIRIQYEGIYFFGGRDEKGAKNTLHILKIDKRPCEWITPQIEGPSPIARYGHTMNYYPDKEIIILFGGRNDENFNDSENYIQAYLNDIWILDLTQLKWIQWQKEEQIGKIPVPRYSHCSTVFSNSVLIFGGLSEDNYCKADIHTLVMDKTYDLSPKISNVIEKIKKNTNFDYSEEKFENLEQTPKNNIASHNPDSDSKNKMKIIKIRKPKNANSSVPISLKNSSIEIHKIK